MSFRTALAQLNALQANLSITDPVTLSVKRVYKLSPSRNDALTDFPCWINAWEYPRATTPVTQTLRSHYTITSQLFVSDADFDRAADIATAFWEAYVDAVFGNRTLNGTANVAGLRGSLRLLEWAGKSYAGLDTAIDIEITAHKRFS